MSEWFAVVKQLQLICCWPTAAVHADGRTKSVGRARRTWTHVREVEVEVVVVVVEVVVVVVVVVVV